MTATDADKLTVTKPDRVSYRGRVVTAGPRRAAVLAALLRTGDVPYPALVRRVWGSAAVPTGTVHATVSRLNLKLLGLGCPARIGIDRGRVLLTWPPGTSHGGPDDGQAPRT